MKVVVVGGWRKDVNPDELEEFDLAIRCNNHWITQGGPIPMLFHCATTVQSGVFMHLATVHDFRNQIKEIHAPEWGTGFPNILKWCNAHDVRLCGHHDETGWVVELRKLLAKYDKTEPPPLTGLLAIYWALLQGHEVHTRGMDLYGINSKNPHKPRAQACVLKYLAEKYEDKLVLSKALQEVVNYHA